jgi:predicted transcriptional regulator
MGTLTIRIDDDLEKDLEQLAKAQHLSFPKTHIRYYQAANRS